jgi:hypothetical protein
LLDVVIIEGLVPLDQGFGLAEARSVPDALSDILFGPVDGIAIQPGHELHSYAVLDAAKVPGLPEMLEGSGLQHACLFQGSAAEELRDAAPWIVRLEENHFLTRALFTRGDGPLDLWDAEAGIFLRSAAPLNAVRAHLRKFTRCQDTRGRWVYFRFWDPLPSQAYLDCVAQETPESLALLGKPGPALIPLALTCPAIGAALVFKCGMIPETLPTVNQLTPTQEQALARAMEARRRSEIAKAIRTGFAEESAHLDDAQLMQLVGDAVHRTGGYGIRSVRHVHVFACWQLVYGAGFEARDPQGILARICGAVGDEGEKIKRVGERLSALHRMGVL